jgi:SUMO ligase MMS21 Smc5/6 complex component
MNTESIHIESIQIEQGTHSNHADLTTNPVSFISTLCEKVSTFFIRSELQKAQAGYQQKQQRQSSNQQDILGSMPLETKLGNGMYRWMD